ncbi:MAG: hypothetical protein RQ824_11280 [bacterium]|nr:hypothetical protein [bacterium]
MYPVIKNLPQALLFFFLCLFWTGCASSPDNMELFEEPPLITDYEEPQSVKDYEESQPAMDYTEFIDLIGEDKSDEPQTGNIYTSPSGEVYVKSRAPVYLRLGVAGGEEKRDLTLRDELSKKMTDTLKPFYFEGHGRHSLLHPPAGRTYIHKDRDSHIFRVFVDGKGPVIKYSTSSVPKVTIKGSTVLGKPAQVSLKYYDKDAGVFGRYVSLNGERYRVYDGPVSLTEERDYLLKYYAIDNVNNRSKEYERTFSLDFTPPESSYAIANIYRSEEAEIILSPRSRITLFSEDLKAGLKRIYYKFGARLNTYKQGVPIRLSKFSDGPKRLVFFAEDRVGNIEDGRELSFYLDSKAPVVSFSIDGDQHLRKKKLYVSGRARAVLTAEDNKSGVGEVRYYGGKKKGKIYSEPVWIPKRNGKYLFAYSATDKVGNSTEKRYKKIIVDVSPPKLNISFEGPHYYGRKTHYIRKGTKVALLASDNLSGIKSKLYTLDEVYEVAYKKSFSIDEEGAHALSFYAIDNVNNGADSKEATLFVDEKGPEISTRFSLESIQSGREVYPRKSKLYLSATDEGVGQKAIYYRINKGKRRLYKRSLVFNKAGNYRVSILAVDKLGNTSESEIKFRIK